MNKPNFLKTGEPARLMPVVADSGKESKACSILMAGLMSIPAFRKEMLSCIGQRVGSRTIVECFTEVSFKDSETKARPDGLIVLDSTRGRVWRCLIEAKIKKEIISQRQIEKYIVLSKKHNIDAILTISNEFVTLPTHSPLALNKNATKGVELFHWSWMHILTTAMQLIYEDDFESNDQKYILSEMIRYFSHHSTGVSKFNKMNAEWKDLVKKIQSGSMPSKNDDCVERTVASWHQEARDICLLLSRKINRSVQIKTKREHIESSVEYLKDDCESLVKTSTLKCTFNIPDAAAPMQVLVDLLRRTVTVMMNLEAPGHKQRTSSKINWLIKQLPSSTGNNAYIKVNWPGRKASDQESIYDIRDNLDIFSPENKDIKPNSFDILLVKDLAGNFSGTRKFVEELEKAVIEFYEEIGQHLQAYVPPPPPIHAEETKRDSSAGSKSSSVESSEAQAIESIHQITKDENIHQENNSEKNSEHLNHECDIPTVPRKKISK